MSETPPGMPPEMPQPGPDAPSPEQIQQELMVGVLRWLATVDSPHPDRPWTTRELEVRPSTEGVPFVMSESAADGRTGSRGLLPGEVAQLVGVLQQAMFFPGRGTWVSAMFTVTAEGAGDAGFNHDAPPLDPETGVQAMGADEVRAHLKIFPRDAVHTPDWMSTV